MNKKISILMACLLFVFSTLVNADEVEEAAANVSFSEEKVKTYVGGEFSLDIVMANFPTTEGGGVRLRFDPSVLEVTNVAVNSDEWRFVNRNGDIDNADGVVSDILFSSYQGVSGNATIATVQFKAIGRGKAKIKLEEAKSNPFSSAGERLDVAFESSKVRVKHKKRNKNKKHRRPHHKH